MKLEDIRKIIREELILAQEIERIHKWMDGGFYTSDSEIKKDKEILKRYYNLQEIRDET